MDSLSNHHHPEFSLDDLMRVGAPGTYLVRVDGHSMTGAGIFDGDLLVVDKGIDAAPGSVVIGLINQEPVCKRLDYECGVPVLRSDAEGYPDRFVMEGDEFAVWGVVTHSVRQHGLYP
jgi:DNA polymerase V